MKMKHALSAGLGLLALGLVATAAEAAPVTGLGGAAASTVADASLVEKTHWRGRYYYGRHRHRPYYYGYSYPRYYGYSYYYPRYYYPRRHYYRYGY